MDIATWGGGRGDERIRGFKLFDPVKPPLDQSKMAASFKRKDRAYMFRNFLKPILTNLESIVVSGVPSRFLMVLTRS